MSEAVNEAGAIAFAEELLKLLDEGKKSATYKYAVLLALIDLCLENSTPTQEYPEKFDTIQLSRKVIELYWLQARVYFRPSSGDALDLRQVGDPRAKRDIVSLIRTFQRDELEGLTSSPGRAKDSPAFAKLVREVERILIEMPLPKLQRLGKEDLPLLYEISWNDRDPDRLRKSIVEYQRGALFDNSIRLRRNVARYLVQLSGLLRPLLQRQWTLKVAGINKLDEELLVHHLFGWDRIALDAVRDPLRDVQGNRCFYCGSKIGDQAEVDHFVPWSLHPNNNIENLVIADKSCNGNKRHYLAAAGHVERWAGRMATSSSESDQLIQIARNEHWEHDPEKTKCTARRFYLRLTPRAKLWSLGHEFVDPDLPSLMRALA